jgi:tRNA-dihydrouridine synthase
MIGRAAYNTPWIFRHADSTFYESTDPGTPAYRF